jgi:DNA-binding response OmpR family regulator
MARILVAKHDKDSLQQFLAALEIEGHDCEVCTTDSAVRMGLVDNPPHLVITDADFPGLDAFEMVQVLQDARGDSIPLLVVHSEDVGGDQISFTWKGLAGNPDSLRTIVRSRLAVGDQATAGAQVLVVDDDPNIRLPLAKRLEMEGFRCQTAQDGEEGFSLLADGFDLVLSDVDMPRLDGFGLLERMRSEPDYRDIPVIIMTAHARSAEEVSRGLGLGANDYVRKPFDMGELVARSRTQLRIREASRLTVEKQRDLAIIELAGAAAHEINNPLSVVMARLELLLDNQDGSERMQKDLEQIDHLVRRIADVVQKMSQVKHYQVQNYCGGINILDLNASSGSED